MKKEEVLRYLRTSSKTQDGQILSLVDTACKKIESVSVPKTLYRIFDIEVGEDGITLGGETFKSVRLAENLKGCSRAVLFGATLGTAVDREINRAASTDVALAMAEQAAAAAEIEEVCDSLEENIKASLGVSLRQRYSPGYFDLKIEEQKKVFALLELTKRTGITLTETFEMLPTKSVTAFIGIEDKND